MAILRCPECGHDVSSEANSCPHCGYPINKINIFGNYDKPINDEWIQTYKKKASNVKIIQVILTIIVIALFILSIVFKKLFYVNDFDTSFTIYFAIYFLGWLSFVAIIMTFHAFLTVKIKVEEIDGYKILGYFGMVKRVLVIENVKIDSFTSSNYHNTDISAKLPNGKKIIARFTHSTMTILDA